MSAGGQRLQQFTIIRILAQLPEHDAAQSMAANIFHLSLERLRTVVAPEVLAAPHRAGNGGCVVLSIGIRQGFQYAVTAPLFCWSCGGLVETVVGVFDSRPALTVKRDAKDDLPRRHSGLQKALNCVV